MTSLGWEGAQGGAEDGTKSRICGSIRRPSDLTFIINSSLTDMSYLQRTSTACVVGGSHFEREEVKRGRICL